jgi:hypothetical protein
MVLVFGCRFVDIMWSFWKLYSIVESISVGTLVIVNSVAAGTHYSAVVMR